MTIQNLSRLGVILLALMTTLTRQAFAQNVLSPEVHKDGTVTFRLNSKEAKLVSVRVNESKLDLTRKDNGVWEGTSAALSAGIHDYTFNVDGTTMADPSNRNVKKWLTIVSMVEIPGNPPLITEMQSVPHGAIHRMIYSSKSVGCDRPVMVYTPPGYRAGDATTKYPLVLLLHGFGDDETAWTEVGRAHFIADNLIAEKKLAPCIIAMPYGHPIPVPGGRRLDDYWQSNGELYNRDIMQDLLPFLDANFTVTQDAAQRSIVGLSMGGGHALHVGLSNIETFSSIGAFSAAVPSWKGEELLSKYPVLGGTDPRANSLRNLWIPIGEQDFLLSANEVFAKELEANKVMHVYKKVPGGHEWKLWRDFLPEFLMIACRLEN